MKARSAAKNFPVVCVGGSAGSLDAYTRLLQHLPTGNPFVVQVGQWQRQINSTDSTKLIH